MFWHSECESRGLGRLPCCTLTVMSPQAGSLRVSFIILSMLGTIKCSCLNRQLTSDRQSPLSSGACVHRATGPCHGDGRTAGLLSKLAAASDESSAFLTEKASAPRDGLQAYLCPRWGWMHLSLPFCVPPPPRHLCPQFAQGRGREERSLGHLAVCPAFQ